MQPTKQLFAFAIVLTMSLATYAADCCCPECGEKVCTVTTKEKTVKKHCFEVECKDICIPKFRWPWQMCCEPRCGRVRTVRVLKKIPYKCKECGYHWEVQTVVNEACPSCSQGCLDCDSDRDKGAASCGQLIPNELQNPMLPAKLQPKDTRPN